MQIINDIPKIDIWFNYKFSGRIFALLHTLRHIASLQPFTLYNLYSLSVNLLLH